jgi:S-adenosylmethionine decarboxylase
MFSEGNKKSSGKHMICDIKNIRNKNLIHDLKKMELLLETICKAYDFTVLNRASHEFSPQGLSILYLLSESHISIHTFPERDYIALDIYTCREYKDNSIYLEIYDYLIDSFGADHGTPTIIDRNFI